MKLEILDNEGNIIKEGRYVKGIITLRMESYKSPSYDFRKCSISYHDKKTNSYVRVFYADNVNEGIWELEIDTNTLEDNVYIVNFILCDNVPCCPGDCGVVYDGLHSQWIQQTFVACNVHCGDYIFTECRGSTGIYNMDCGGWVPYNAPPPPVKLIENDPNCITINGGNGDADGINGGNGGVDGEKTIEPILVFSIIGAIIVGVLINVYFIKQKL